MATPSNYASKLPTEAKSRYIEKLELITNEDPFEIGRKGTSGQYEFKAYSLLEAYNQFTSWWVKYVRAYSARVRKLD